MNLHLLLARQFTGCVLRAPAPLRWLLLLFGLVAEGTATALVVIDPVSLDVGESAMLAPALALHLPATVAFACGLAGEGPTAAERAWPRFGLVFGLAGFPGWGMALVLVARLLARWRQAPATIAGLEELADLDYGQQDGELLTGETSLLESVEVEPLVDLLHDSSLEARRAAIDTLASTGGARSSRTLAGLLQDPSAEVRFYASIGLAKIENQVVRSIVEAQAAAREGGASGEAFQRLGDHYFEYGTNALVDAATARFYLTQAEQAYRSARELDPGDPLLGVRLARTSLALGQPTGAIDLLEEILSGHSDSATAVAARMEAAYAAGRFGEIPGLAERLLSLADTDPGERDLAAWWAGKA